CLFYLCSVVPCVWILELRLYQNRLMNREAKYIQISGVKFDEDFTRKLSEVGLVLIIIAGRWILPRGPITRDQLSALLLEYVAIAADILEIFESFEEKEVRLNYNVTIATLSIYSWSLLQFTFSFTAFSGDEEEKEQEDEEKEEEETRKISDPGSPRPQLHTSTSRKYLRKLVQKKEKEKTKKKVRNSHTDEEGVHKRQLHGDVYGILAAIFMQDGPYFGLRMYMITKLNIKGELQFFFAGKNAVTIALLLYRLYALQFKRQEDEDPPYRRFRAASFAILGMNIFKQLNEIKNDKNPAENSNRKTKDRFVRQLSHGSNA
ncbi:hypothetical protein QZH41_010374, partial [Actinostola sp. cb2023]